MSIDKIPNIADLLYVTSILDTPDLDKGALTKLSIVRQVRIVTEVVMRGVKKVTILPSGEVTNKGNLVPEIQCLYMRMSNLEGFLNKLSETETPELLTTRDYKDRLAKLINRINKDTVEEIKELMREVMSFSTNLENTLLRYLRAQGMSRETEEALESAHPSPDLSNF